jgi:hypothetical protein
VGSQYWSEGRPASAATVEAADGAQIAEHPVVAVFRVVPFDHALLRSERSLPAASQVRKALDGRDDKADVAVSLYLGDKFGTRTFQFREVEPKLFAADLTMTEEAVVQTFEYWAPLNNHRAVDYVMSCRVRDRLRSCSSQFFLAGNVASVTLQPVKNASQARKIFEAMRTQIRSYVVSPALDVP